MITSEWLDRMTNALMSSAVPPAGGNGIDEGISTSRLIDVGLRCEVMQAIILPVIYLLIASTWRCLLAIHAIDELKSVIGDARLEGPVIDYRYWGL